MVIEILPQNFSICKVTQLSQELLQSPFSFVGKTDRELSLVCETMRVPEETLAREDGWRGFRIAGTLEFSLVGILSGISRILADEKIGIFAVSTYDTDYIFVKAERLAHALEALERKGYVIRNV